MSSSGSDSSDDDDDEVLEREAAQLRAAIKANPNAYESYLQLIQVQRKIGDLDGVRAAREQMAAIFPLSADIWMPWLEDEARLASTEAERRAVLGLYDRAVGDYLSVALWLSFCAYAEEAFVVHGLPGGLDAVRAVYERALAEAGLHFALGAELWAQFRAFERRVAEASGGGQDRVLALFRKQLRLPMAGLASVRVEFEQGVASSGTTEAGGLGGDTALQRDHARALKGADTRARLENALVEEPFATQPTQAQLAPWLDYAKFEAEQSGSSHARTLSVYERAVASWPLSLELWLAYVGFAEGSAARTVTAERLAQLYTRAVRNIGWSGTLWCGYLRNLQQAGHPDDAIQAAFAKAVSAQLGSADDVAAVHLVRCTYLRGRLSHTVRVHGSSSAIAAAAAALEQAFEDGQSAAQSSPVGLCNIQRLWAAAAAVPRAAGGLGLPEKARSLWNDLLKVAQPAQTQPAGLMHTVAMAWLEAIEMERRQRTAAVSRGVTNMNSDAETDGSDEDDRSAYETLIRGLYKRAMEAVGLDNPVAICESWLQWEREEGGSLASLHHAEQLVQAKYAALRASYGVQEQPAAVAGGGKKRKASDIDHDRSAPTVQQQQGQQEQQDKRPRKEKDQAGRPRLDPKNLDRAEVARMRKAGSAAAGHAEKPGGARKTAQVKKGKIDHEMAVFVKNLPFDVDDTALYTLFSEQIGPVVQARLVIRKETGKSRGFGYVEFASAEHVTAAIKRQEQEEAPSGSDGSATASQGPLVIEGRKLSISRSNMSEAIMAEQQKKEEAAARKKAKEDADATTERKPRARLMGLPRALRGASRASTIAGVGRLGTGGGGAPQSNAQFAALFKKQD